MDFAALAGGSEYSLQGSDYFQSGSSGASATPAQTPSGNQGGAQGWSPEGSWIAAIAQGAFSARQAAIARDYNERMAGSVYQRRAADLAAAGLNPVLAATGGAGSAPTAMVGQTPDVASAVQADRRFTLEKALNEQQLENMRKQSEALSWQVQTAKFIAGQENTRDMEMARRFSSLDREGVYPLEAIDRAAAARASATAADIERGIDRESGVGLRYGARLAAPVSSAASLFRSIPSGGGFRPYSREAPGPAYLR